MTNSTTIDIRALESILEGLTNSPKDIEIKREVDELGVLINVRVSPEDMGVVIGRNGIMATSIKTIIKAIGKANDMNIRVQFLEPDGSFKYANKKPVAKKETPSTSKQSQPKKEELSQKEVKKAVDELDNDLDEFVIN